LIVPTLSGLTLVEQTTISNIGTLPHVRRRGRHEVDNESYQKRTNRRSFIKKTLTAAGTAGVGAGLLYNSKSAFGQQPGRLTAGDAAILRFLAAAEILESDLWEQYWELSSATGVNSFFEAPNPATGTKPAPTGGNAAYTAALQILDGDMPQYINDNTDDEFSHANFLMTYLKSKGASTQDLYPDWIVKNLLSHLLSPSSSFVARRPLVKPPRHARVHYSSVSNARPTTVFSSFCSSACSR
jgi:hypothetical protein